MDWSELGAIRSRFVENKDEIWFWTSLALDGAKVSAIVGTSSGLFIVVAYLRSVGAPLPITDISATVAFLVIAAAYGFVAIFLVATLYSPALVCAVSPRDRRIAGLRPLDPDLPKLRRLMIIASYYILFHAGPLAVIAVTICGPRHRDHAFACFVPYRCANHWRRNKRAVARPSPDKCTDRNKDKLQRRSCTWGILGLD